ncbi:NHLP bacteriocin system secretion protein [Nitrospirillum amazonense]|uniref:NHLP bacteriocin system secretion protein n=1 Tax=Nitrospirillum amazonense TaxID=28077 RepID=UPI00241246C0|nr:NHLP bacteriocin system secretion protein [Nitrospirillum amazonense]MDG3444287.1 NHLP bacteriocin system secretion protein [Nitrospirillum amazonense]
MSSSAPAFRPANPDQLDRMVRVSFPLGWLVFGIFLAAVLGGLAWSLVATAPVKVAGNGVLQGSGGVALVTAPSSAAITALKASVGGAVHEGEIVAVLADPVLDARLETVQARLARLEAEEGRLKDFQARARAARTRDDEQRRQGWEQALQQARQREAALGQVLASQHELMGRGYATRERILMTENDRAQAQRDITAALNALNTLGVEADERAIEDERELLELESKIGQGRQDLAEALAERAARTEVRAPITGRVIELSAATGDRVAAGSALMRLVPEGRVVAGDGLVGILYVAPADGKKIRPGMAVQIIPSTVKVERDGFIHGEVIRVSETAATREAVQQTLKNDAFVTSLMANGPPFEVRVALRRDPATVSGFAWSSSRGAARPVESGTVIKGGVVVERTRIIALAFPAIEPVLDALGLDP